MIGTEDDILIENIRNGDENAFKVFYEENSPSLRYFASKYIEYSHLADDIVQEALVSFWNNRKNFNSYNAAKSYIYKTVRNSCLNSIRHKNVKKRYHEALICEDNSESFLDNILEAEIFDMVLKYFEKLPDSCKQVYKLSISGLSHAEIADKLGITINTVKKHKNNAHHFIRERIGKILGLLLFMVN